MLAYTEALKDISISRSIVSTSQSTIPIGWFSLTSSRLPPALLCQKPQRLLLSSRAHAKTKIRPIMVTCDMILELKLPSPVTTIAGADLAALQRGQKAVGAVQIQVPHSAGQGIAKLDVRKPPTRTRSRTHGEDAESAPHTLDVSRGGVRRHDPPLRAERERVREQPLVVVQRVRRDADIDTPR